MNVNTQALISGGGLAACYFVARVWARYNIHRRTMAAHDLPLFDIVALEIATTPARGGDDDTDVLAEIRETFRHLNRQAYAEEVWALDKQLTEYYGNLPEKSRPTMRRCLMRLIECDDKWLQIVAAKTASSLTFREAAPLLREKIAHYDSLADDKPDPGAKRFRDELAAALARLEG